MRPVTIILAAATVLSFLASIGAVAIHDKVFAAETTQTLVPLVADKSNMEPIALALIGLGLIIYGILSSGKRK